ncbi:pectinesterase-like [Salvia miltiorrhiza]|uniref:pectinesterase-like n=1 Tax=Salvia miltiorrhiza TaxID=226208 RepID=UPI0025AD5F30|nr:pectinesterase-like [Salvia miltiorrhiza]
MNWVMFIVLAGAVWLGVAEGVDVEGALQSAASGSVEKICSYTSHAESCSVALTPVANNKSATLTDYLQAAIKVAQQEVEAAKGRPAEIGKAATKPQEKMAVDDCKELLQFAVDELQASMAAVGESSVHTIAEREAELKNWLSAVLSYHETCIDGFETPEIKEGVSKGLLNATELTDNALAIVGSISNLSKSFNMSIKELPDAAKSLLDGFPGWMKSGDRKLLAAGGEPEPNAVVAQDGSGQYKTIQAALDAYPKDLKGGRYVIYVKAGVYDEYITITKDQLNIYMYGDGPRKSIVTGKKSFTDGVSTFKTASFSVIGNGFICKSMGFRNTAGPQGHQAVALRVQSDMSAFFNCRMDGYQDTLYVQTHRQFYRNCLVSGTVDFIFGDSAVILQNCLIIVRKPMEKQKNTVTAQGRTTKNEATGIVIQNCKIVPEKKLEPVRMEIPTYLGRPWKDYSMTLVMESWLADFIQPEGWLPWTGTFALDTCFYREYNNRGPGSTTDKRVNWKGYAVMTNKDEAQRYTVGPFLQGEQWLPATTVPFSLGLAY